jgi:hypothetical protein
MFGNEIDILKILEKIRNTDDILSNLVSKQDLNMLKISRQRVIDSNEEEEIGKEEDEERPIN